MAEFFVGCLRCADVQGGAKPARKHRLRFPQPDSTPPVMRWAAPGPALWMCDDCSKEAAEWAEPADE